ncbi:hypothetical protein ACQ4PT_037656 [Festuca glaucescens]
MMALALALSYGAKLRSNDLVAHNDSVFFWESSVAVHRRRATGSVAIGVHDLNDMLVAAYYSSSSTRGRRSSCKAGKRLFRGTMGMEEALSMLGILQDTSGYMEGSRVGKVLLLKGKENQKSLATTHLPRVMVTKIQRQSKQY